MPKQYVLVLKNTAGNCIQVFEQNQFDQLIDYIEKQTAVHVSMFRIELVEKH